MSQTRSQLEQRLALVAGVLDDAFFMPLHLYDWMAYCLDTASLLRLSQSEVLDLYVRAAVAAEAMDPDAAQGRAPLAWLWSATDTEPVLAHALVSLRDDRPFLFHRVLWSLPAVRLEEVMPENYELMEDFFSAALRAQPEDLTETASQEIETLVDRGLQAAGLSPAPASPAVAAQAQKLLESPPALEVTSDVDLRLWLVTGGLDKVEPDIAPAVLVEVWRRWCGAITGVSPDMSLLTRYMPELDISSDDLALMAPVDAGAAHAISAACPYCHQTAQVRLGPKVEATDRCEHLLYVGTDDAVHLWEVVSNFEVGQDMRQLMSSYYQSPPDLDLFATIVNDLFEMLAGQGRLEVLPVNSESAPRAFYHLMAFFGGPPHTTQTSRH